MDWSSCISGISSELCFVNRYGHADTGSWTRYKLNKPSFMRRYETFFDGLGRNPSSPRIDAETLKWLPLMFIVVSTISSGWGGLELMDPARHRYSIRNAGSRISG
jgi:hypothetical protein